MNETKVALGGTLLFIGTLALLSVGGIMLKSTLGVWDANVDRKIFESNKSHIHGTIQALNDLKLQYEIADSDIHRRAFREAILSEYSAFKHKKELPNNLVVFINNL